MGQELIDSLGLIGGIGARYVSFCDGWNSLFALYFKLANESGTKGARIADSSRLPASFTATSRARLVVTTLDQVWRGRTRLWIWRRFLKFCDGRSRIRMGKESMGIRCLFSLAPRLRGEGR